jgi:glycosyltransferase involved in cell wall biosynthesis
MKILFLSIGRLNSLEDEGIYTDLLREFRNNGHDIFIVHPREKRLNKPTSYTKEEGVHFLRVKIGNITKVNILQKGIATLQIERSFLKAIKKYLNTTRFDLVIYSTPPITFSNIVKFIKNRDGAKSYLLLKDIFPQNALDLEMFDEKSLVNKYFRKKEIELYSVSDIIGCMSPRNKEFLINHNPNIEEGKVEVCPNSFFPKSPKTSRNSKEELRQKYNLPKDKTIFIYGGNLGKPQGIDFLINCLESNKNNSNVFFVIAGGGTQYNKLKKFIQKNNLPNVLLYNQLPKIEYDDLLVASDVGLIFLDYRFTIPNFPSRLLSYLQASKPIIAATDPNTDVGEIIEKSSAGYWCKSNDVRGFNDKIHLLCNEKTRREMGGNSKKLFDENYTTHHTYNIIMSHFL